MAKCNNLNFDFSRDFIEDVLRIFYVTSWGNFRCKMN